MRNKYFFYDKIKKPQDKKGIIGLNRWELITYGPIDEKKLGNLSCECYAEGMRICKLMI